MIEFIVFTALINTDTNNIRQQRGLLLGIERPSLLGFVMLMHSVIIINGRRRNGRLMALLSLRVWLTLTILFAGATARAEKHLIQIVIPARHGPAQACADALMNSRSMLADAIDGDFRVISFDEPRNAKTTTLIRLETRRDALDLAAIPFAFRDAQHFQTYLKSDLAGLMPGRGGHAENALAYGGFFQMFSRTAAVTEPKHLYGRYIGGDARAISVYHEFGAMAAPSAIRAMLDSNFNPADDFKLMGQGHIWGNIVEALLGQAFENGANRNARYVSLISASVLPIAIEPQVADEVWHDWNVAVDLERRLLAWARSAALNCSGANYDAELNVLERLKQAGLTIVPFNRSALVEASWRMALTQEHQYWTIAEFDRLEQLDGGTKGALLPSEIVAKLPAAKRQEALKFDQAATEFLSKFSSKREPQARAR